MMKQIDNNLTAQHHRKVRIPVGMSNRRLDKVLSALLPEYSRATLQKWLKAGLVTVGGRSVAIRDRIAANTMVVIECHIEESEEWLPQPLALDIVAEDEYLLVVNKPAGLIVHPGAGNPDGTLVNALLYHDPGLAALPRAGIVHRLDKDTSGLLVVARTEGTRLRLIEQLRTHTVFRQYDAVVFGHPAAHGTINAAVGRSPHDRIRMAVTRSGKPAVSHYRLRERFRSHSWLTVRLETGRTHQIRVHMCHIGFPLVGDPVYGGRARVAQHTGQSLRHLLRSFPRQALHAGTLSLVHPGTSQTVTWKAPLPEDMQSLISALRVDTADR